MERTKNKKKIALIICAVLVIILLAANLLIGNYLVSFAITRSAASGAAVAPEPETSDAASAAISDYWGELSEQRRVWLAGVEREDVSIESDDGLRLVGDLFPMDESSHRYLIAVHGYTGKRSDMYAYAMLYAERGFNVLTPDMRSHGESDGRYIGMGWLDRKDILKWIDLILDRDPQAEIVLHGVSMGGATVMMTSGEALPKNVVAIVDDCGYTSVWDVFSDELKYLFHLPDFPFLYTASGLAKLRAGYTFGEASALEQVKKSETPILFIHGSEDNFVHTEMVYRLYDTCPMRKELYVAEGAGHGQSLFIDPEQYVSRVFGFLDSLEQ